VSTVTSGWSVEQILARVEWRFATTMHGALYVMTSGGTLMPVWSVDS